MIFASATTVLGLTDTYNCFGGTALCCDSTTATNCVKALHTGSNGAYSCIDGVSTTDPASLGHVQGYCCFEWKNTNSILSGIGCGVGTAVGGI
ncbi:hypothetical protein LTR86_010048 [Recurvomyces mirabilis]|nr:hypothetical protein LTR86_010048 [Recurvomyces mirabilis]